MHGFGVRTAQCPPEEANKNAHDLGRHEKPFHQHCRAKVRGTRRRESEFGVYVPSKNLSAVIKVIKPAPLAPFLLPVVVMKNRFTSIAAQK